MSALVSNKIIKGAVLVTDPHHNISGEQISLVVTQKVPATANIIQLYRLNMSLEATWGWNSKFNKLAVILCPLKHNMPLPADPLR